MARLLLLAALAAFIPTAAAQDSDDFDLDDLDEDTPVPAPSTPAPPPIEGEDDLDDLDDPTEEEDATLRDPTDSVDLLEGEEDEVITRPGGDTAESYRAAQRANAQLPPDEEIEAWERYLAQYPGTSYRDRIDQRMEELMSSLYTDRIGEEGGTDALTAEVPIAQGLLLENINPRTRLQAGFEWGIPSYINLIVDYEQALSRTFSFHGGVRRRYSGWSVEPGVHWAMIKSTRTKTLLTVLADAQLNTNPAYAAIRPQLAFGQRLGEIVDVQAQAGAAVGFRSPLDLRWVGGANVHVRASETVGIYLETLYTFKASQADAGAFAFNVATFGMRFFPGAAEKGDDVQASFGASVPYAQQYWQYHYGSFTGQGLFYFD